MLVAGVDPGLDGAIALVRPRADKQHELVSVLDMPVVETGKKRVVLPAATAMALSQADIGLVVIEQVSSRSGEGVTSAFTFGKSYGIIIGAAAALKLRIEFVTPPAWKGLFKLTRQEKDAAREMVLRRFPEHAGEFRLKKHVGRADAALIALYGIQAYC